jgi:hypothetical protein
VDSRLVRWGLNCAGGALLVIGAGAVTAQQADQGAPTATSPPAEAPAAPPAPVAPPPAEPATLAPQATMQPPEPTEEAPEATAPKPKPLVTEPLGPPRPIRAPTAVLQVLDKITAETLRFEAPVGRRVRYKTIVFTVRACETRGPDDPEPRPSAYVVIESQPPAGAIGASALSKQLFKGWMFANAPSIHPLEHPIYDAWLIACSTAPPPA